MHLSGVRTVPLWCVKSAPGCPCGPGGGGARLTQMPPLCGALSERLLYSWLCRKGRGRGAASPLEPLVCSVGETRGFARRALALGGRPHRWTDGTLRRGHKIFLTRRVLSQRRERGAASPPERNSQLCTEVGHGTANWRLRQTSASPAQSRGLANFLPKMLSAGFQALAKLPDGCGSKFSFLP